MGRSHKYIPVHDIVHLFGHSVAKTLPGFHTFTGCDTVSSFHGERKEPCWDIFQLYSEFIPAFRVLSEISPTKEDIDAIFPLLNKFTARLYQNNDEFQGVDSLRHLLIHKVKSFDSMRPGIDSLKLKSYRAEYQRGHIWENMLVPIMNPPSPSEWVWIETPHSWVPQYTNLDIISSNLPTFTL